MRVLLVTATELELAPLVARLSPASPSHFSERLRGFTHGAHHVDVLTTGVGMVATAAWCGRVLARQSYDLTVNLGVCGSFDPAFPLGTVVNVVADCIAELGAEDDEQFLTVQQLGLLGRRSHRLAGYLGVRVDLRVLRPNGRDQQECDQTQQKVDERYQGQIAIEIARAPAPAEVVD